MSGSTSEAPSNARPSSTAPGPYPEIDLEVPTASKLPVTNLEGDGHLVVPVQDLVEAFSRMRAELDVVRCRCPYPTQRRSEDGSRGEPHGAR